MRTLHQLGQDRYRYIRDGNTNGTPGEYGDGPDLDGNGIPDEIGINPDSLQAGYPDYPDPTGLDANAGGIPTSTVPDRIWVPTGCPTGAASRPLRSPAARLPGPLLVPFGRPLGPLRGHLRPLRHRSRRKSKRFPRETIRARSDRSSRGSAHGTKRTQTESRTTTH